MTIVRKSLISHTDLRADVLQYCTSLQLAENVVFVKYEDMIVLFYQHKRLILKPAICRIGLLYKVVIQQIDMKYSIIQYP